MCMSVDFTIGMAISVTALMMTRKREAAKEGEQITTAKRKGCAQRAVERLFML